MAENQKNKEIAAVIRDSSEHKFKYAPLIGISIIAIGFIAAVIPFFPPTLSLASAHKQLPFQGTTKEKISNVIDLLNLHSKRKNQFLDIGCGDGRILMALSSKSNFQMYRGIEINSTLYLISKMRAAFNPSISIEKRDFFQMNREDLVGVDAVFVFGIPGLMRQFRDCFEEHLKEGTIVLTNKFALPDRTPDQQKGEISLYIIRKKVIQSSKLIV
jgi:hypothetical protein